MMDLWAWAGQRLAKVAWPLLVAGLVLAVIALGAWGAAYKLGAIIDQAAATARAERDAHWQAEIAKSNAETERRRAERTEQVAGLNTQAMAEIDRLRRDNQALEAKNAALPVDHSCGLGRARVRLLPP